MGPPSLHQPLRRSLAVAAFPSCCLVLAHGPSAHWAGANITVFSPGSQFPAAARLWVSQDPRAVLVPSAPLSGVSPSKPPSLNHGVEVCFLMDSRRIQRFSDKENHFHIK